jgi:hypothetical protein
MNEGSGPEGGSAVLSRALRLSLLCLVSSLVLAACAGQPHTVGSAMRQPKNPAHGVITPETANVEPAGVEAAGAEPAGTEATLTAPKSPSVAPATIWQSADKLMGLAAEELLAALGKPARIRDEEASRIYQYIGSDCVLDLFLYQESAGAYRVSYAEARSVAADKKPVDSCLKSLPAPVVADNVPSS